jgi:outer membrane biosynthesis protein TonB
MPGDKIATFKSQTANTIWKEYLNKVIKYSTVEYSGKAIVNFTIDTYGKCVNIYMRKSLNYFLDNDAKQIINKSPLWDAAIKNGKKISIDFSQPFVFEVAE